MSAAPRARVEWVLRGCLCALAVIAATVAALPARARTPRPVGAEKELVVTLVTPTQGQEVLPDLSDPGLNGVVTIRFSSPPRPREVIDPLNTVNRLAGKVEFLDGRFSRVPGTARLRGAVLTIDPRTTNRAGVLEKGPYSLNLRSTIRNRRGRLLNRGVADVSTSFTVGTDVHGPTLRRISPLHGQAGAGRRQSIVATFDEPLAAVSVAGSAAVVDASTVPATPVPGAGGSGFTLERGGFDLVFRPDPCFGFPPSTTIEITLRGAGTAWSGPTLTDRFGNPFSRGAAPGWSPDSAPGTFRSALGTVDETTGLFRTAFRTRGAGPEPAGLPPGSPQFTLSPTSSPCAARVFFAPSCYATGMALIYTTSAGLGELSLVDFVNRFNQGVTDLSLVSILPRTPVPVGRVGGVAVDPRWDPSDLHTLLYVVDQRSSAVLIVDSRTLRTIGRLTGFGRPRDLSVSTDLGLSRTTLWVSDFSASTLVGIGVQGLSVRAGAQPGAMSACDALTDDPRARLVVPTARGPTGVAADAFLRDRVAVACTLDDALTIVNVRDGKVLGNLAVGGAPVDVDWLMLGYGTYHAALVANQGGPADPMGSLSLYFRSQSLTPGRFGAGQARDGIEATLTDEVRNPTRVWGNQQWLDPRTGSALPLLWLVPNTGGETVIEVQLGVSGLFGVTVQPSVAQTHRVGQNPTSATFDPFFPMGHLFAAVSGSGTVAGIDFARPAAPVEIRVPGVRELFTAYSH